MKHPGSARRMFIVLKDEMASPEAFSFSVEGRTYEYEKESVVWHR